MFDALASTIALVERQPTPLAVFLASLPGSWEVQLFYGLMLSGTAGMVAHYLLKWARDEIQGNLFCYLWLNKKSTCLSLFTYIGISIGAIASGAFTGEYGGFVGWKVVFWMGATNGFTIDAIVNRTRRAEWDFRKRIAKTRSGGLP